MHGWSFRCSAPVGLVAFAAWLLTAVAFAADAPRLELKPHDKIVLVGNALAERMQYFGHFETLLHSRFPNHELVVRNLGWSADEISLRPRSKDFADHGHTLAAHNPNVILAFFGFNESFAGPAGLERFEADLERFIADPTVIDNFSTARSPLDRSPPKEAKDNRAKLPNLRQIVLVSPIPTESWNDNTMAVRPNYETTEKNLAIYIEAMGRIAAKHGVAMVDLYNGDVWARLTERNSHKKPKKTINGVHLSEYGDQVVGEQLDRELFGERPQSASFDVVKLKSEVNEKNLQFFYDYRAVNGYYIYGGRKNPFGVVNFPVEFAKLRKMIEARDRRIWAAAQGKEPPAIESVDAESLPEIPTNYKNAISLTAPEEEAKKFELPEGYAINLFASEADFPELANPVQMTFDAKGRLWVSTMETYPQYLPGKKASDKILILEDTDGDGRADKRTVFADGLHVPTGLELGSGGVYVAQQPNLMFLKDTNGDDVADVRELVLHGFDSADSHHSISAFTYDQGGALYFEEGTFHHTQVETPYGPTRLVNAGVFRWEPRSWKFDVFVSFGFANPWGHVFDAWGQDFVADASGGANYFAAAFSGDVDYPNKHGNLKQFLTKQWRPTAGCELVSSRNFPDEAQGNYLLNNCIGFQGVLQYRMKEDQSGFSADPLDPLLRSSDPNFRPVDLEFGPDGALYVVDWFNPLVGHMQHNLRDPNRDHAHGRIWRIHYTGRPLVKPTKIAGATTRDLLDVLANEPEERTQYRARIELWNRDAAEVLSETKSWLGDHHRTPSEAYANLQLEVLWLHQAFDVPNAELLKTVLKSPEPKARAAATRVLCYWRDRLPDSLALLQQQVNDEHPRVRLEAVRALSFFHEQRALEIAVETLIFDMDDYLKYTLDETMKTLERRVVGSTVVPDNPTEREKKSAAADKARGAAESVAPVNPRSEKDRAK